MFEQLRGELPWTQRLSEVWRMRDPEERQASLALRSWRGNRLRHAIGWYRTHDRLHTGDPVAMASDVAGDAFAAEFTSASIAGGKTVPAHTKKHRHDHDRKDGQCRSRRPTGVDPSRPD
jgi:hypothetical protein